MPHLDALNVLLLLASQLINARYARFTGNEALWEFIHVATTLVPGHPVKNGYGQNAAGTALTVFKGKWLLSGTLMEKRKQQAISAFSAIRKDVPHLKREPCNIPGSLLCRSAHEKPQNMLAD